MDHNYKQEIDDFIVHFDRYKDKRIVLYGIGRMTATILKGETGFKIVGLMDRDITNVGKYIYGVPVISISEAEKCADLIIINTAEDYWGIIYQRICDSKLPVFYRNGEKAQVGEKHLADKSLCVSVDTIKECILDAEIISFDFFDTLFQRKTLNPRDVFRIMEYDFSNINNGYNKSFNELRTLAKNNLGGNYSFDALYQEMSNISGIKISIIKKLQDLEYEIEDKVCFPRYNMLKLLKYAQGCGKDIYIISDMYLPKAFYLRMLSKVGCNISANNIYVSSEMGLSKESGELWQWYSDNIVKTKKALHIGDDSIADKLQPEKNDIYSVVIPNSWKLLVNSPFEKIVSQISSGYDTAIFGLIFSRLFSNPFCFSKGETCPYIDDFTDLGYIVFGPVILTFLLWLINEISELNPSTIAFLARDGFFLNEDYSYVCDLLGISYKACYVGISRQLAMEAAIRDEKEIYEYALMPYSGNVADLFVDRFQIDGVIETKNITIESYINDNINSIQMQVKKVRDNYKKYLDGFCLDDSSIVVDIGYYGNNQKYLNKILGLSMPGYYFAANLDSENSRNQRMKACFQSECDKRAEQSGINKNVMFLESFLTAPYGMIRQVDSDGNFVCAPSGENQKSFKERIKINNGVKQFIKDYVHIYSGRSNDLSSDLVDEYFNLCIREKGVHLSEGIAKVFFYDNAMMNRYENPIFE